MTFRNLFGSIALGTIIALPAMADTDPAVGQRQGQFNLFLHNFGVMGAMVQGRIDYDADLAQTAANNLFHLTRHDQSRLWPEGTDSTSIDGTRAKAEIWENLDDFVAKFAALQGAAETLQGVAGNGLDALQPAFGATAGACQACHQVYREEAS